MSLATSPLERSSTRCSPGRTAQRSTSTPPTAAHLRTLIAEVIDDWPTSTAAAGGRARLADPDGVAERAFRNLARYGPLTELLDDDDVWEIMVNAPDEIFVRRHSGGSRFHHEVFHDDDHVVAHAHEAARGLSGVAPQAGSRPRASRMPSSTTAPGCTSSTAI